MMKKYNDVVFVNEEGVKVTVCAPRSVGKNERTYDPARSKYSQWNQGVSAMRRGVRGVQGTMG
jgi:hypothetical protein